MAKPEEPKYHFFHDRRLEEDRAQGDPPRHLPSFFYGAKIGVLGLNGSGKCSLLRILAGRDKEFDGRVHLRPGYTVGFLEQEPQLDPTRPCAPCVEEGVEAPDRPVAAYDATWDEIADGR